MRAAVGSCGTPPPLASAVVAAGSVTTGTPSARDTARRSRVCSVGHADVIGTGCSLVRFTSGGSAFDGSARLGRAGPALAQPARRLPCRRAERLQSVQGPAVRRSRRPWPKAIACASGRSADRRHARQPRRNAASGQIVPPRRLWFGCRASPILSLGKRLTWTRRRFLSDLSAGSSHRSVAFLMTLVCGRGCRRGSAVRGGVPSRVPGGRCGKPSVMSALNALHG
jgi:hypothetical protein